MKNKTLFLSRLLIVEQRYLAVKDTTKFQNTVNITNKNGYFYRNIISTYIMNAFTFVLFSVFINSMYFNEKNILSIASFGILLFSYLFLMGIFNSINYLNTIFANNMMGPLKSLPMDVNVNVPFISWFVYNASSYIFVMVPSIVMFYLLTGDLQTIFLGVAYSILILVLSFIISSAIFIYHGTVSRRHSSIKNVIRLLFTFVLLGFFYIIIENPDYFTSLTYIFNSLPFELKYFLFPINLEYIIYLNYLSGLTVRALEVGFSILFFLIMFIIYVKTRGKLYYILMTAEENSSIERIATGIKTEKLYLAFLKKDIKTTFRKVQNLTYIFLPILFVLPFFLAINGNGLGGTSISIFSSMIYLTIVVSTFYSIFLLVVEGKGIEILDSLPITKNQIAKYKTIYGMAIFIILTIIFLIVMYLFDHARGLIYIVEWINIVLLFYIIIYINIRRLIMKLPEGSSGINYYSFGRYPMFMLFAISVLMVALSLGAGILISFAIYHIINYFIYFDVPVNIILLFVFVLNKKIPKIRKYY